MDLQINSLETRIEKMQEMFNKDLEEIKNSWVFIGRTDVEAEAPILWPPDVKN